MKYLFIIVLCASLIGCVYPEDYNSTFWDYVSVAKNSSGVDIHNFCVSKKGHDRLMINRNNLYSITKNSASGGMNIPIRGTAYATWIAGGVNYSQEINLNEFNLFSYKDAALFFEINENHKLLVYLGKWGCPTDR